MNSRGNGTKGRRDRREESGSGKKEGRNLGTVRGHVEARQRGVLARICAGRGKAFTVKCKPVGGWERSAR